MSEPPTPVLELRDLERTFGATRAVSGVSARFSAGEYVCILGPSGCGKTTLLRLIAGFEEPTSGRVLLDGVDLDGVPPERRDVNVVFQSYALFPHLDVAANVAFGLQMKKRPAAEIRPRVEAALRLVQLDGLADRLPRQLSGGQQQRVALARALINEPRVLLLDEPLSALDRHLRIAMQEELRALQRRTGVTFVHITHDQAEAMSLADRLVVMREGRFVQAGPPADVYRHPASRFVAEFVGTSNLIDGRLRGGPDRAVVELPGGIALPVTARPDGRGDRPVLVSIRPETIRIEAAGAGATGRVRRVSFAGATVDCTFEAGSVLFTAHVPARVDTRELAEGQPIHWSVDPGDIVLLDPSAP